MTLFSSTYPHKKIWTWRIMFNLHYFFFLLIFGIDLGHSHLIYSWAPVLFSSMKCDCIKIFFFLLKKMFCTFSPVLFSSIKCDCIKTFFFLLKKMYCTKSEILKTQNDMWAPSLGSIIELFSFWVDYVIFSCELLLWYRVPWIFSYC